MKPSRLRAALATLAVLLGASVARAQAPAWTWYELDANQEVRINLYLFWSASCPHCADAVQFLDALQQRHPWVKVTTYEITGNPANRQLYQQMAASFQQIAGQTPAFFYCKHLHTGYVSYEQTGRWIEQDLVRWHDALQAHYRRSSAAPASPARRLAALLLAASPADVPPAQAAPAPPDLPIELPPATERLAVPGLGEIDPGELSLPVLTLVLAGCDAFNPCAFFVLLLLLSLLVHGQQRVRMLLVGGVFVFFSGLIYFLLMAAWLNLFFVIGHLAVITTAAGLAALVAGLLNVKEFFWFKQGPSLSLPDRARPGLFRRMAGLINASRLPSLLGGAAALAIVANLYELLCTSGFPMVYTRVLTLRELPVAGYYGYLVLYNLIYVAPLALIVLAFVATLGARKLTEYQGRVLKLLSGLMMLTLGVALMAWPDVLNSAVGAAAILAAALGVTVLIVGVAHGWRRASAGDVPAVDGRPRCVGPSSRSVQRHKAEGGTPC